jgi:DNA-binding NarL/FixJ family response regulator
MQLLDKESQKVNINATNQRSLVVVLAESNVSVRHSIVDELTKDHHLVTSCSNCGEIDRAVALQTPDLFIFGNLPEISILEAYRKYANQFQNVPIVLLTDGSSVNQFFRDWVISKGVYEVLSSSPQNIHLLKAQLQQMLLGTERVNEVVEVVTASLSQTSLQGLTYLQVIAALNQLTDFSKKYFGEMVLGNYWKKAHTNAALEHPWIECWSVEYTGGISYFSEDIPDEQLTDEQYQSLKLWVRGFLKECDRIIGGYVAIVLSSNLSIQVDQIISLG